MRPGGVKGLVSLGGTRPLKPTLAVLANIGLSFDGTSRASKSSKLFKTPDGDKLTSNFYHFHNDFTAEAFLQLIWLSNRYYLKQLRQ